MDIDSFPTYDNPPSSERVRGLLCGDTQGQVQVIAPEASLVDPRSIQTTTARKLTSIPSAEDVNVSAIPGYYGLPAIIPADLTAREQLALATEIPGQYVRATGAEIQRLTREYVTYEADFCNTPKYTPANTAEDISAINTAVDSFTERRIRARLDETLHIPPLPEAAQRIIALRRDPNFDLADLVSIVEADPAIAARLMGWANSPLYARENPARDLNDAIMRCLGFDMVINMALGMAIGATLALPKSHVSGASPYWLDAVYGAATAEALAYQVPPAHRPNPGACYLVGLLSNFGTLVVGHVFPPQYESICRISEANPRLSHTCVDQHVLGVNREVIAARLLAQWELPDEIHTAIRHQHIAGYAGEHAAYVQILQLAQALLSEPDEDHVADLCGQLKIHTDALEEVRSVVNQSQDDLGELAQSLMR